MAMVFPLLSYHPLIACVYSSYGIAVKEATIEHGYRRDQGVARDRTNGHHDRIAPMGYTPHRATTCDRATPRTCARSGASATHAPNTTTDARTVDRIAAHATLGRGASGRRLPGHRDR